MSQNIYDDPVFYSQYEGLDRQVHGLKYAPEWKVVQPLVPDLKDAHVLDLGCGSGWVCRYAREHGAASALGIDVSATMLEKGKRDFPEDKAITYEQRDLEDNLELPTGKFDFVFSSLAFHYVVHFPELVDQIGKSMKPGGTLLFTCLHPIRSAGETRWVEHVEPQQKWAVDKYLVEGTRLIEWLGYPVKFQHRTITGYFKEFLRVGFVLQSFTEWAPKDEELREFPFWSKSGDCPVFMIFKFTKS